MTKIVKILTILIIYNLFILVNSSLAARVPENIQEAQKINEMMLEKGKEELPGIIKRVWEEEVLPIWRKMYVWFDINIGSKIKDFYETELEPRTKEEIERRKPIVQEEFKKEKAELKEEWPELKKNILERFLEIWR
jgi:hypothetical protein